MRILCTHNIYKHRGGEDSVFDTEISLLRDHGHTVDVYYRNNNELGNISSFMLAHQALWSARTVHELTEIISSFRPNVIHAHNTFPLISPSLYWAAARVRVPVVQTLHNFRLMCLNAMFLRDEKTCEDCMGQLPWLGVIRACYRGSHSASALLAAMLVLHRCIGTYHHKVTRYIALNEFCRNKFITGGLPAERIVIKPNFVDWDEPTPPPACSQNESRRNFLFVGRMSAEKGVATLAMAIQQCPETRLRVAGNGPDKDVFIGIAGVTRLGTLPRDEVLREMASAMALVVPSICYENFPRTIVEAFATGLPVIASRIGSLANIVRDGETGLLFTPGDAHDLAEKMIWASTHPDEMRRMGVAARQEYERLYTPERNYQMLMDIYRDAIAETKGHGA